MKIILGCLLVLFNFAVLAEEETSDPITTSYYFSHHRAKPLYGPDFKHLSYANPDAPKGGDVTLATIGTFDSLNPYIVKGEAPAGLRFFYAPRLVHETLMFSTNDDLLNSYGYIAETIEYPKSNKWVAFNLRKSAYFHDKTPITADDVVFTFNILRAKGQPFFKVYYADVENVEKINQYKVKFNFKNSKNSELPVILGQLPVLSKKYWKALNFEETTLEPPIGNGPYRVAKVDPGRSITYERVKDHWAKDLPVNRGCWNFDKITYDYYRDSSLMLESFLGGDVDFRHEVRPSNWFTRYDTPAIKSGEIIKEEMAHETPSGWMGLYFNLRRDKFKNRDVREALTQMYDFEFINKNYFYGKYKRIRSVFQQTELASSGLPKGEELEVLNTVKDKVPEEVFTKEFQPPKTDGSGNNRSNKRIALRLLKKAGYKIDGRKLIHKKTKQQLAVEILIQDPGSERVLLPFVNDLRSIGIDAKLRQVDSAQYQNRLESFSFDMVTYVGGITYSPGNEQEEYWGSKYANFRGGKNIAGISDPAIDQIVQRILNADDRETLVQTSRALDRIIQWNYIAIPLYYSNTLWVAYKNYIQHPKTLPKIGLPFHNTWWIDPVKFTAYQKSK
jgi:microcin C transport system substrate-binding protein